MKNLFSISSQASSRFLMKNKEGGKKVESTDLHDKISSGVGAIARKPLEFVNYVADKTFNVLESGAAHTPLVGKPLSYIPTAGKKVVKSLVKGTAGVLGGVLEGGTQLVTRSSEGLVKGVKGAVYSKNKEYHTGLGGATLDGALGVVHKPTSKTEKEDLNHGSKVRKARAERIFKRKDNNKKKSAEKLATKKQKEANNAQKAAKKAA